jgi:hypothetical protein
MSFGSLAVCDGIGLPIAYSDLGNEHAALMLTIALCPTTGIVRGTWLSPDFGIHAVAGAVTEAMQPAHDVAAIFAEPLSCVAVDRAVKCAALHAALRELGVEMSSIPDSSKGVIQRALTFIGKHVEQAARAVRSSTSRRPTIFAVRRVVTSAVKAYHAAACGTRPCAPATTCHDERAAGL